ncbi:phosphoserine phosphatase SerB [Desulforhopalus sp. 52FAK]
MAQILILVSSSKKNPLLQELLDRVSACIGGETGPWLWLEPGKAAELFLDLPAEQWSRSAVEDLLAEDLIDSFVIEDDGCRKKKLLISDMDNTMVIGETLDDLAAACNLKDQIATITEKAMCGEIDFPTALRTRVKMLRGLSTEALGKTEREIEYMPGAETLVRVMGENGVYCVLVSGGFTCFTEPVAHHLGFHAHHGNVLQLNNNLLTGMVEDPILDHNTKLSFLRQYASENSLTESDCLAVGDGANDLAMISAAGLGVGFHPKAYLRERAKNSIVYGDLTALLYVQGYSGF